MILRKITIALVLALVTGFYTSLPATAQDKSVKPGINDKFKDPNVKEYVEKFEGESREIFAHREKIVDACKLKPGMTVADIGAGTGLFTRLFGKAVGPKGKVYAVDIAPKFIAHIEKTSKEINLNNVTGVVCDQFSSKLPPNSVDLVFICDTYHHFEFPVRTMSSIHDALKPGGQLVLIDFKRIKGVSSDFVMNHVRAGQEVFTKEILSSGFRQVEELDFLKENYFVRFEKVKVKNESK